ncbi:V-type proton ATPase 116 kDa subunit a1-like isoform X2 [Physella acuta]|uniref:V-type proton ATPase 116 kDa subunit a1-like isoform X2 n=1 Tax=Physella acuta TaxID=109671 RepID=UPI0027DBE8DA|nr:V-type proton ATPase 116 kDa subunit a1-like isoform X2 [Physella acuta]
MGSLFRSEEMRLCQMFLQSEAAYACVSELGELGLVQFKDLNAGVNAFQRTFVAEVRRCEEMERKLRYVEKEMLKENMKIPNFRENPKAPAPKEMNDLEVEFEKIDSELRQVTTNNEALKQNYLELTELREVLFKTQSYFATYGNDIQHMMEEETVGQQEEAIIGGIRQQQTAALGFFVGTVLREKVPVFERVMKFITHSTVFMRVEEIEKKFVDPISGDELSKCMFIVFYQGDQLRLKVKKVCEGMRGTIYPVPDSPQERNDMLNGVNTRIADLENVLAQSNEHRHRVLSNAQRELRSWTIKVEKIKAIYHTLNMFKIHQNSLHGECWFPVKAIDDIRRALSIGEKAGGSSIPSILQPMYTDEKPPTYYNTNKFVKGFQNIVDSYGVATYGEVNPAPYTIITFPFLFAVMFGDAGHGMIMFLFALALVINEKSISASRISNEIAKTFFGGRYIILLMGAFSVYTGMIYNDIFSKSFNIFGSKWYPHGLEDLDHVEDVQLDPITTHYNMTSYAIGIDPVWQPSTNKIMFLNSLKMKMAIILGVIQMLFGICLQVFNHIHFKSYIDIFIRFIPELLFLGCLFGYLVSQVIYKWIMFDATTSHCAPALLIHYINMFMFKYEFPSEGKEKCDPNLVYYKGQDIAQYAMFFIAILSVPVLLIVKPVYLICKNKKKNHGLSDHASLIHHEIPPGNGVVLEQINYNYDNEGFGNGRPKDGNGQVAAAVVIEEEEEHKPSGGHGDHEDHGTGEIVIHQAIHTIEFCLGCISHTASYLRLWALSLAHAQLSEVLWNMVLRMGMTMGGKYIGGIVIFIIFFIWANLTVAILLLMEGLSAFLHTLRLHWVEFQSKFYVGEGYRFLPFNFKHILNMESLEEVTG